MSKCLLSSFVANDYIRSSARCTKSYLQRNIHKIPTSSMSGLKNVFLHQIQGTSYIKLSFKFLMFHISALECLLLLLLLQIVHSQMNCLTSAFCSKQCNCCNESNYKMFLLVLGQTIQNSKSLFLNSNYIQCNISLALIQFYRKLTSLLIQIT